jgi:hypothetical protein
VEVGRAMMLEAFFAKLFGKAVSLARFVDVESHPGSIPDRGINCQFVRITNRSINRKVVVSEVWFEFGIRIPVMNSERLMPRVILSEEVWETWIPLDVIPESFRLSASTLAKVRLSDGTIISSKPTQNLSVAGFVAG